MVHLTAQSSLNSNRKWSATLNPLKLYNNVSLSFRKQPRGQFLIYSRKWQSLIIQIRIITEQICEVETQTIVFQQFQASISSFSSDLSRKSGRSVGYDSGISGHYGDLVSSNGSLSNHDLGFSGHDLGRQYINVHGSNWNWMSSPASVGAAHSAAQRAAKSRS